MKCSGYTFIRSIKKKLVIFIIHQYFIHFFTTYYPKKMFFGFNNNDGKIYFKDGLIIPVILQKEGKKWQRISHLTQLPCWITS